MAFDLALFSSTLKPLLDVRSVTIDGVRLTDTDIVVGVSYKSGFGTFTDEQSRPLQDGGEAELATDWAGKLG